MNIITIMLISLCSTIIIELLIARLMKIKDKIDLLNIFLVNLLTNPLVVSISFYINVRYGLQARDISMVFLELFAVLTEGFIYKKYLSYKKINPFILSIILNIFSYTIGCVINYIVW